MRIFAFIIIFFLSVGASAQNFHINENFDACALPSAWTNTAVSGSQNWAFGQDGATAEGGNNNIDGTCFAYFDDDLAGSTSTDNTVALLSPVLNLSNETVAFLEFDYNLRTIPNITDSFMVDVFDGSVWQRVLEVSSDDCGRYLGGPCSSGFPHAILDVSPFLNAAFQLRFTYHDGNDWGWYVGLDNIALYSPYNNDVLVSEIIRPASACGLSAADSVEVVVKNIGLQAAQNFNVSFAVGGLLIASEPITQNILPNDSIFYTFSATANLGTVGTYTIEAFTQLTNDQNQFNDTTLKVVENEAFFSPTYTDGFEGLAGSGNWTVSGSNASWQRGTPSAPFINTTAGGVNIWATNVSGSYNNNEISYLTSPCLDFSTAAGDPTIGFALNYRTELGTQSNPFDYLWMEVSTNNGASWNKLMASPNAQNWYNNTTANVWEGNSAGWINVENLLTGTAGSSQVKVRLAFQSDGSVALDGVGFDNVFIVNPQPIDIQTRQLLAPLGSSNCGLSSTQSVVMEVLNKGSSAITTFDASYRLNGGTIVTETVSGISIPPNTLYTYAFTQTADFSSPGTYDVDIWAKVNGDSFEFNDSLNNIRIVNNSILSPFVEDFNTFTTGIGFDNSGDGLANGWTRSPQNTGVSYFWGARNSNTSSVTGPGSDHNGGGGGGIYMYTVSNLGINSAVATLTSPCLNFSNANGAILSFWYHKWGASVGNLFIDVHDGNQWINGFDVVAGQTHAGPANTHPYLEKVVNLNQFAGQSFRIRFRAIKAGFQGDMAIDDILIYEPIPQDARLRAVQAPISGCNLAIDEDVTIAIENFGTTRIDCVYTCYQVNGGAIICDTLKGITILPGGSPITHTFRTKANLSSPGSYTIKAWTRLPGDSNLGNDSITDYVVINETKTFPILQDFQSSTVANDATGIDGDWEFAPQNTTNSFRWNVDNSGTPTLGTGPLLDHTLGTSSGNYIYTEANQGIAGSIATVTSPCVDLTNVPVANLEFWYHMFGSNVGNIYVDIFDGNLWNEGVDSLIGQQQTSQSQPWRKRSVSISNFVGNFINIRFRAERGGGISSDMAIDDIELVPPPPQQVALSSISRPQLGRCFYSSSEDVRIRLRNVGGDVLDSIPVSYRIFLNGALVNTVSEIARPVVQFAPGTSFDYTFNTKANFNLYGNYRIEVEANLPGDVEPADDIINDYTFFHNDPTDFPFSDGFENLNLGCRLSYGNGFEASPGAFRWCIEQGNKFPNLTGPSADHTRKNNFGKYFMIDASGGTVGNVATLETQCLDLQNINAPTLQFWYHKFGFDMGDMYIDISDDNGWVVLDSILGETQFANSDPWKLRVVDLSAYMNKVVRLRWRGFRGGGAAGNMAIDDIFLFDVSDYDIGPTELLSPNESQYQCYSAQQSLTIELRNFGNERLDFTQDSLKVIVTADILKDGLPWATLIDTIDDNVRNYNGLSLEQDSLTTVVLGTFDMSGLGANYEFEIRTQMLKDSIATNDTLRRSVTTEMKVGTIAIDQNNVCNGASIQLTATAFQGSIQWQRQVVFPGGATVWVDLNTFGSDSSTVTVLPDTSTLYRYTICDQLISDSVLSNVTVVRPPIAINDSICGPGELTLGTSLQPNIDQVRWYESENDTTHFHTGNNYTSFFTQSDTFYIQSWDDSCQSLVRTPIYAVVNPFPIVDLVAFDTLCEDTSLVLNAGPGVGYTYQWYSTDTLINGSNLQAIGVDAWRLEVGQTYQYAVSVKSPFNCITFSDTTFVTIEDSCLVGIETNQLWKGQLVIYPNPAQNSLFIDLKASDTYEVDLQLYAAEGRLMFEEYKVVLGPSPKEVRLDKLPKGLYYLQIIHENESMIRKIIRI